MCIGCFTYTPRKPVQCPTSCLSSGIERTHVSSAGIFKHSMGARNRVGIGLSYTGLPGYTAWRNSFLVINSWASYKFKNLASGLGRSIKGREHEICSFNIIPWFHPCLGLLLVHSSRHNTQLTHVSTCVSWRGACKEIRPWDCWPFLPSTLFLLYFEICVFRT